MTIEHTILRFEGRSQVLRWQAWGFLIVVGGLLAFGVYIVFSASSLTTTDIGGRNFDGRMAANRQEQEKIEARKAALTPSIEAQTKTCANFYQQAFSRWPVTNELKPDGGAFRAINFERKGLPHGYEIARRISAELEKPENKNLNIIGIQLVFEGCTNVLIVLPRDRYSEIVNALTGKEFNFDRAKFNSDWIEQAALDDRSAFLNQVWNTIYSQKVQAEASGNDHVTATSNDGNNELLLRLLQTSITRFGVLAVVGFLVSILVSLYRYNIRLAAFYTARADVLRLKSDAMTATEFSILATALSPNLEFGRTPQPPLAQLVDLIRSAKDAK